jgi:hypothetical protein
MKTRVIAWWSGGVTSALACWWALQTFKNVAIVFLDTKNEDDDTYRFKRDCEALYGQEIETLTRLSANSEFRTIEDIWFKYLSLNVATGAICSSVLKREMREAYQNLNTDFAQVFGFDANEKKRHLNMRKNYPELNVISPCYEQGITKAGAVRRMLKLGVQPPRAYKLGFQNNNCLKTGCVQGGLWYWQKMKEEKHDEIFLPMARREHKLTDLKGEPVTICKDQGEGGGLVFLLPHPDYPHIKDISMMKGRAPKEDLAMECTGFCSTKD